MDNIKKLFETAKILNHVNLSGMNIKQRQILQMCHMSTLCPLLMGIHLSDNGISLDKEFMLEILDIYGIGLKDIPALKRPANEDNITIVPKKDLDERFEIDYDEALKPYMRHLSTK